MSWLQYVIDFAAQRQDQLPMMDNVINRATDELASQRALLREAAEALKPFARANELRKPHHDGAMVYSGVFTWASIGRAAKVYAALLKRLENG